MSKPVEFDYFEGEPDDEPESCHACEGDGFYHDCGDVTCCCANPAEDDLFTCDECGGTGYVR